MFYFIILVAIYVLSPVCGVIIIGFICVSIGLCSARKKILEMENDLKHLRSLPKVTDIDNNGKTSDNYRNKKLPPTPSSVEEYESVRENYSEAFEDRQVTPFEEDYLRPNQNAPNMFRTNSTDPYVGPDIITT